MEIIHNHSPKYVGKPNFDPECPLCKENRIKYMEEQKTHRPLTI